MRKFAVLLISFILCYAAVRGQSTNKEIPPQRMSFGIETVLPAENLSLIHSFGLGVSMKTITPFTPFCGFTLSAGAIEYFSKHNFANKGINNLVCFPLKAGINFFSRKGIYAEPQIGYSLFSNGNKTEGAFCYAANIGCVVNSHIDFSICYEVNRKYGLNFSHTGMKIAFIY
jgi:hypothetical protein